MRLVAAVWLLGTSSVTVAGSTGAQVVRTPEGVVAFIGLQTWTVEMVRDSMRVYAPEKPLGQCAAVLRALGFPAASAHRGGLDSTFVVVVEPRLADRIRRRPIPGDTIHPFPWADAVSLLVANGGRPWQRAVDFGDLWRVGDATTRGQLARIIGDTAAFLQALGFLAERHSQADLSLARHALAGSAVAEHRMVAAGVLSRFPMEGVAWQSVLEALTDQDSYVAAAADQSLGYMLRHPPEAVDLQPARPTIRTLVAGAFPMAVPKVLEVVTRLGTSADAQYALVQNEDLVLALLESTRQEYRRAAHGFLVAAHNGTDLGTRAADWMVWISQLRVGDV